MTHIKPKSVKHSLTLFEYFKCNQNTHLTALSIRGPVHNFSATTAMKSFVRFFSVFFIFACANIFNIDAAKCKKVQFVGLVDCSDLGLTELPKMDKDITVKVLDLRKNNIKAITESSLLAIFPNIVVVDLRENPLDCKKIQFTKLQVKSDCTTRHVSSATVSINGTSSSVYTNLTSVSFTTAKFLSSYIATATSINSTISNVYSIPTNVLFTSLRVDLNNTSSNIYSNFVLTSTTVKIVHSDSKRIASIQDSIKTTTPIILHNSSSQPISQHPKTSPGERKANINKNLIWLIVFLPFFTLIVACVCVCVKCRGRCGIWSLRREPTHTLEQSAGQPNSMEMFAKDDDSASDSSIEIYSATSF